MRLGVSGWTGTWLALGVALWLAGPAAAITHLKPGAEAPEIALKDAGGGPWGTAKLRGQVVLVMFGEVYHDKTQTACGQVANVLKDKRLIDQKITAVLITAQEAKPEDYRLEAAQKVSLTVLRDPDRKAFGAYQVAVMPSLVVIDKEGKVVTTVAGLVPRFEDTVTDALLVATGKLDRSQADAAGQPTTAPDETALRAGRLAALGRQLVRRGLDEMAIQKFDEALTLNPHETGIHEELGLLKLKHKRLAEAEKEFRAALTESAGSVPARLGLAFIQTTRGGKELDEAEKTVLDVLAKNATLPRAHYLLGLIQQQRGKAEDAAKSFKKAAELLLERSEEEAAP